MRNRSRRETSVKEERKADKREREAFNFNEYQQQQNQNKRNIKPTKNIIYGLLILLNPFIFLSFHYTDTAKMAMVATTAAPPTSLLNQDSLSHIDILMLSQSELHASAKPSTNPLGPAARPTLAPPIPTLPSAIAAASLASSPLRPNPNPSLHLLHLHRRGGPSQDSGKETMKGGDETHVVGLGSSLHRSLSLVLFLCFWLVFCFWFYVS